MEYPKSRYRLAVIVLLLVLIVFTHFDSILSFLGFQSDARSRNQLKLNETLGLIEDYYVDEVNWDTSIEGTINGLLKTLDPHSIYITPSQAEINDESFEGKYQGIGIQFDVLDGYITVISVIPGSPSETVGIMAGDKITKIDGHSAYEISTADVPKKLKGPVGSKVTVTVQREGIAGPFDLVITRDEIPIFTVHTYFMADEQTGYISVNRFANTTSEELEHALIELEKSGMKRLLLDLRENGGGFLKQAVEMVGKFIPGHKKVVYTKGRLSRFDKDYYTDEYGKSIDRDYPLIIMIDGGSASASEIVAGAIQDYDRGLVIGETSFGKGLVQNEFVLKDDSRLRLTISKYYTPSGRLIQRPYLDVDQEEYFNHQTDTLQLAVAETDSADRPVYHTEAGRIVYGGGGINPDIRIPFESGPKSRNMMNQFWNKRIFFEIAVHYVKTHSGLKKDFQDFLENFTPDHALLNLTRQKAEEKKIEFSEAEFLNDLPFIKNRIKAEIARNLWGNSQYYQVLLQNDNQFLEAIKLFPKAEEIRLLKPAA